MTIVDLQAVKEGLAALVERAEAGEEIFLARDGRPVVQLLPRVVSSVANVVVAPDLDATPVPASPPKRGLAGIFRGHPWLDIDLDAPLDEDVARAFGMLDE